MQPLALVGNPKLIAGFIIGAVLGFVLVKSELAWRKTVTDQFAMRDNTFFRTLFFSLAVGVLLFYFAEKAGMVRVQLHPTFFWAAEIGGLICAFGMSLCGQVPSTAVAALASGRFYVVWVIAGMLAAVPFTQIVSDFLSASVYKWPAPFTYNEFLPDLFSNPNFFLWVSGTAAVLCLFFEFMPTSASEGKKE
jgi:uncharacterized membrane protein YedE/YeeE